MTLEITTPEHAVPRVSRVVKADGEKDLNYYLKWVEKGYKVKELKFSTVPESQCLSCEG